jgi:hypothetical protein
MWRNSAQQPAQHVCAVLFPLLIVFLALQPPTSNMLGSLRLGWPLVVSSRYVALLLTEEPRSDDAHDTNSAKLWLNPAQHQPHKNTDADRHQIGPTSGENKFTL